MVAESAADWVDIGTLKPWADNPRINDGVPVKKVAASIKRFGFAAPILARMDGEIIAGHTRLKAAQSLGLAKVPVRFLDLSVEEAHLLALADNRTAEESEWDKFKLGDILRTLKEEDFPDIGFDSKELKDFLAQSVMPSFGPEADISRPDLLQKKWKTESGQLWCIPSKHGGKHCLICGDSCLPETYRFDVKASCMWTDPPYGVSYVGKTADALQIKNDKLSPEMLRKFLTDAFNSATTSLAPNSSVYIAGPPGPLTLQFELAFLDAGWTWRQKLVWVKNSFVMGHSDYHYRHEEILYGKTPGPNGFGRGRKEGWLGGNCQESTFFFDRPSASKEHPTMKPPELIAAMIGNSCEVGGHVLDPFCGSGSTMVAAESCQRLCLGIELDPKYIAVCLERMSALGRMPELI